MKQTTRWLLMLLLCVGCTYVFGQDKKTISGSVKDSSGIGLPGVSIQVVGTKIVGSTDNQGNFQLSVPSSATAILFSSIGYKKKEQEIKGNDFLNVQLENEKGQLNEVVVTAFGQKKSTRKISYAVTEVKGEDITRASTPNIVNAMQGKVAGVMINQGAGGPQSTSRIRIRGNSNVTSNNTMPLFVIDGVLIKPSAPGSDGYGNGTPRDFGNELRSLNPDDYESLTVLKGSAATALYGSDGLNGVVVITSKKGKTRRGLGVNVSQTVTWDKAYKGYAWQNEFGGGINPWFSAKDDQGNDKLLNDDYDPYYSFGPKLDGHTIRDVDGQLRPFVGNDIMSFFKTGNYYNTNVSVEGATERSSFRISYTNNNNKGITPFNTFKKDALTLRATQKISSFINIDAVVNYTTTNAVNPLFQGGSNYNPIFRLSYSNSRNYPLAYALANYLDTTNGGVVNAAPYLRGSMTTVYWQLYQNRYSQKDDNLRANIDINFNIRPWLTFLIRGNINSTQSLNESKLRGTGPGFLGSSASYSETQSNSKDARVQALLTASRKLSNDFDGSLTLGGETKRGLGGYSNRANTNGGFKRADYYNIGNSVNAPSITANNTNVSRLDAAYAYGDITWRNMLTANFSARNDWNSTLTYPDGRGDFSYFYPSIGLAWVFTELLNSKPKYDFISYGKLRASFGYVGSGPDIYKTSTGMGYSSSGNYTDAFGNTIALDGFTGTSLGNLYLKPQKARELEFGAELKFLDNRVGIDFAWYKKNTFNEVIELGTPGESGVTKSVVNAGNIQNKGIEILLTGTPVRSKNFEWNVSVNFARNRNLILNLDTAHGQRTYTLDNAFGDDVRSVAEVGKEFGTIQTGYAYAYNEDKSSASYGKRLLNASGLFYRSRDINQGTRDLGTMMEKFTWGATNEFRYKDFFLFVQVDSKIGGKMASGTHQYGSQYGSFKSTLFGRDAAHGGVKFVDADNKERNDGIIPDGVFAPGTLIDNVDWGNKTYAEAVAAGAAKPLSAATYYDGIASWASGIREYSIFENSWVSLREISVGYNLPKKLINKIHLNNLRVSLIGRNLLYLYNTTPDGINPESLYGSKAGSFAEYGGLPYIRSYGVSVNAGF